MTAAHDVILRRGELADAAPLAVFAARTFEETFAHTTSAADMAVHLARSYGPSQQGAELADPAITTILGCAGPEIVAYAQVRPGAPPIDLGLDAPVEVYRFYVDGGWHGRGLAQRLMTEVLAAARNFGGHTLWLSVWEGNERAKAYYQKAGFADRGRIDFWLGDDRQTDCVYVRSLPDA